MCGVPEGDGEPRHVGGQHLVRNTEIRVEEQQPISDGCHVAQRASDLVGQGWRSARGRVEAELATV